MNNLQTKLERNLPEDIYKVHKQIVDKVYRHSDQIHIVITPQRHLWIRLWEVMTSWHLIYSFLVEIDSNTYKGKTSDLWLYDFIGNAQYTLLLLTHKAPRGLITQYLSDLLAVSYLLSYFCSLHSGSLSFRK